jgi:NAD(P)-dependent dehydrogenase (short-subunit alcohol dehydrogenase family)
MLRDIAGGKAVPAVGSAEDGEALVKIAVDAFGGLHILIANAGILRDKSFAAMTEQEWDAVMAVHLRFVRSLTSDVRDILTIPQRHLQGKLLQED